MFRLHEKSGKEHVVPANHNAESYVDAYLDAAQIRGDQKGPLFRSVHRYNHRCLTPNPLHRVDVHAMIKRRGKPAGLPETACCHTLPGHQYHRLPEQRRNPGEIPGRRRP